MRILIPDNILVMNPILELRVSHLDRLELVAPFVGGLHRNLCGGHASMCLEWIPLVVLLDHNLDVTASLCPVDTSDVKRHWCLFALAIFVGVDHHTCANAKQLVNLLTSNGEGQCTTSGLQGDDGRCVRGVSHVKHHVVEIEVRRLRSTQVLGDDTNIGCQVEVRLWLNATTTGKTKTAACGLDGDGGLAVLKARRINFGVA